MHYCIIVCVFANTFQEKYQWKKQQESISIHYNFFLSLKKRDDKSYLVIMIMILQKNYCSKGTLISRDPFHTNSSES